MKWFATALVVLACGLPAYSQQKAATKTAPKAAPAKQAAAKQAQTKQLPAKGVPAKQPLHNASTPVRRAAPRYYYQTQPTPDRYKEIQEALAARGYFNGSADGTWGPSSTEALKRFQHDQNLAEEGKIDALSLTALGLGPRRTTTASVTLQPASP